MKVNVNVRIGNKWHAVITEWENYQKWEDFAFKKWGYWGLENTDTEIVRGIAIGKWKEIKNWEELFTKKEAK